MTDSDRARVWRRCRYAMGAIGAVWGLGLLLTRGWSVWITGLLVFSAGYCLGPSE